jgi:hypothetical protein
MRKAVWIMVISLVVGVGMATAAEVTLSPTGDAPVFAHPSYINNNYGSQTYGYWGYYNYPFRTFCQYNLTSVSGTVTKVQLYFQLMQNNYATGKMWACKVTASWSESTVTWSNQPTHDDAAATGRMLDIDWVSGNGPHTVTCTSTANTVVQGWINTPATNYGLVLKKNPESGNTPRCYPYMREAGNPVKLIVTYTPSAVAPESLGKVKALFN